MALLELVKQRRAAIVRGWLERTLQTYPPGAASFFRDSGNRFGNPVGHRLTEGIEALFDALIEGADAQRQCEALDPVVQLRAVQELSPAEAIRFVFELKHVVREAVAEELEQPGLRAALMELEARIDQLALFAFDIYTRYRQRTYELRVEEIKRRVSGLMRRTGMFVDDPDQEE